MATQVIRGRQTVVGLCIVGGVRWKANEGCEHRNDNRLFLQQRLYNRTQRRTVFSLPGIYPKKSDLCSHMFVAVLFTMAKMWRQAGCPSMD